MSLSLNRIGISETLEICSSQRNDGLVHEVDKSPTMEVLLENEEDQNHDENETPTTTKKKSNSFLNLALSEDDKRNTTKDSSYHKRMVEESYFASRANEVCECGVCKRPKLH